MQGEDGKAMFGDELFYNRVVTIFNKKVTVNASLRGEEEWFPTVINNVRLLVSRGNNVMKSGLEAADSARLHILDAVSLADDGKTYVSRIEFDALSDSDKLKHWTLDSDTNTFFVEGDVSSEEVTANFFEAMKKKHSNCYRVSNVDRFELIPHWEVWGK